MSESSFDPARYVTDRSRSSYMSRVRDSSADTDFNIDDIHKRLANLRGHADVPIRKLNGRLHEDYVKMVSHEKVLYHTSSYQIFQDIVDSHFGDLTIVIPGTVGAHFAGCNVETSLSGTAPACSAVCAGSMPRKGKFWQLCDNSVYMAENTDGGFSFSELASGADRSHAHIFINYGSLAEFPGFTKEERAELTRLGIKKVFLHSYKHGDYNFDLITDGAIDVKSLKLRKSSKGGKHERSHGHDHNHSHKGSDEDDEGRSWWWIIIAVIIFVILLIILIYALMCRN